MRALADCLRRCYELGIAPTPHLLIVSIASQRLRHFHDHAGWEGGALPAAVANQTEERRAAGFSPYQSVGDFPCSTSRFGIGQVEGSNCTPLGLHRVAEKIGDGEMVGAVFRARQVIGHTSQTEFAEAKITTRILWLDGLEPGFNRGSNVDSHARCIYIHGTGDQSSIGRPASHGCVHLADADLIPLFDALLEGTLVWIVAGEH
jgi:hypothetical protein